MPATHWAGRRRPFQASGTSARVTEVTTADYFAGKQMSPRPVHSTLELTKLASVGFEAASADDRLQEYLAAG
jgi:dTDP-4-dehydrorhamnose 3,5-epimerase